MYFLYDLYMYQKDIHISCVSIIIYMYIFLVGLGVPPAPPNQESISAPKRFFRCWHPDSASAVPLGPKI